MSLDLETVTDLATYVADAALQTVILANYILKRRLFTARRNRF